MMNDDKVQYEYKILLVEMAIVITINVVMNWYWTYLIVLQLIRLFKRGLSSDGVFGGAEEKVKKDQDKNLDETTEDTKKEHETGPILDQNNVKSDLPV